MPGSGVEKYSRYFKYKKLNFTNGKGIQNHQISDHAIGLLLCLTRKINLNIKYDQNVKFDKRPIELNQKKVVIVGFGGNGKMIAEKLDFVGKLENISNDFEYIKKILGIQESLKHLNKSSSNKLSYDEDAHKLITILYKEDIKLYNKDTAYTKF